MLVRRIYNFLTHSFPSTLSLPPENIRTTYCFLMFPGGIERVHWERMGEVKTVGNN